MSAVARAQTFWRSAVEGIRHQPFVHAVSTVTLAIALFTLGLARSAGHELDRLVGSLGGEVRVTVYLDPRATAEQRSAVAAGLRGRAMAVEEVTPRAALDRLVRELGPAADSLQGLSEDPLPPSLEVRVPERLRAPETLRALAGELRATPAVTGVDYGEQAVERLTAIARARPLGRMGGLRGAGGRDADHRLRHAPAGHLRPARGGGDPEAGRRHRPLRPGAVPPRGRAPGARRCGGGHRRPRRLPPDALAPARIAPLLPPPARSRARHAGLDRGAGARPGRGALGLSGSYLAVHRFLRA